MNKPLLVGKARNLPYSGAPERCFTWVGSCLTRKHLLGWKGNPGGKHSSLLRTFTIVDVESYMFIF
jgi:hypothetical protein